MTAASRIVQTKRCATIAGVAMLCGIGAAVAQQPAGGASPAATDVAPPAMTTPAPLEDATGAKDAGATGSAATPALAPPADTASAPKEAPPKDIATPRGETAPATAAAPVNAACTAVQATLDAARAARKLADGAAAFEKMKAPAAGCKPDVIYCAGRTLALAHVEAAYAKVEKGDVAGAEKLLLDGRRFGDPWQLLIGLGDAATTRAHARHDRKDWMDASAAYQHALIAFGSPSLCASEAALPEPAALQPLFERMGTAMLLADTPGFVRMKCGGLCEMPFLSPIAGFKPASQILPITFEPKSATLTPNGASVVKALAVCMQARKATQVTLAARTSAIAPAKTLADARLQAIRRVFDEGGSKVELTMSAEDEPSPPADRTKMFSRAELNALSERIELRDVTAAGGPDC